MLGKLIQRLGKCSRSAKKHLEILRYEEMEQRVLFSADAVPGLDAIHLVSHGTDGAVKLGASWLDSDNLDAYIWQIPRWSDALANDADLMFYGCDLAKGEDGRTTLEAIGALTGG